MLGQLEKLCRNLRCAAVAGAVVFAALPASAAESTHSARRFGFPPVVLRALAANGWKVVSEQGRIAPIDSDAFDSHVEPFTSPNYSNYPNGLSSDVRRWVSSGTTQE